MNVKVYHYSKNKSFRHKMLNIGYSTRNILSMHRHKCLLSFCLLCWPVRVCLPSTVSLIFIIFYPKTCLALILQCNNLGPRNLSFLLLLVGIILLMHNISCPSPTKSITCSTPYKFFSESMYPSNFLLMKHLFKYRY